MKREHYAEWLARGRAHQARGRAIDAMLCYRRALQDALHGADAQFHLGEVAWQLGKPRDAIEHWRAAVEVAPRHVASLQALADACAATGQLDAARDAALAVLARRPGEPRATALTVMLRAARGDASADELLQAIESRPVWPLALMERVVAGGRSGLEATSAAGEALLERSLASPVDQSDVDALRAIACWLARNGQRDRAAVFAERYASHCKSLHRGSTPLRWPLRTAGRAARIGLLISPAAAEASALPNELIGAVSNGRCELILLCWPHERSSATASKPARVIGKSPPPPMPIGDGHDVAAPRAAAPRMLPSKPEAAARDVAYLDLDVLIDLAGIDEPSGPLLAAHPARALWGIDGSTVPLAAALVDRVFQSQPRLVRNLAEAIERTWSEIDDAPASAATASALSDRWETAVRSHQSGDSAGARSGYAWVLEQQPGYAPAHYLLGVLERDRSSRDDALSSFGSAVAAAPDFTNARVALAALMLEGGDVADAVRIAGDGLALSPDSAALWRVLGQAELKRGGAPAALAAFAEALRRDATDGESHYNQGVALQMQQNLTEAARAYQRALAFRPDLHSADFNLGVIFDQQGKANAAIAAFTQVLARAPGNVAAYKALGETLLASGRIDAWFANFDRFEQHCPDRLPLAAQALEVCAYRGDHATLERYLDGLRQGRFSADDPHEALDALQQLLYLLLFFDVEPDLAGRYARTHEALARQVYGEPFPRRENRQPGKLRIGYVSGDFRNHVMGKMMYEALRHHDRARFDVVGYATTDMRDDWSASFEQTFSRLHSLTALSDRDAARRIAENDLDVLVDLSTHTKGARPGILALKPARVQITHVASAGTLAMSSIDFKLTDRYADLRDDTALQIEPLLAMQGCVYPFRHVEPSPGINLERETLRIADEAVVIGAFCTPLKLSRRCLELWREVLIRVPGAILAFSPVHPSLRSVFQRIVLSAGIESRRIAFVPQGRDDAENQARYRLIDFVLDPMPYGGVNGTLEALDMGVPVVTLVGRRHSERTSYSILANLGVTDTIAEAGGDYVAIAVRLATDADFMRSVRERIAAGLRCSSLTDMQAHARHLENAYIQALEERAPEALPGASV